MASVPLAVVGGLVQVGGFALALHDRVATRREELPDRPALHVQAAKLLGRKVEGLLVRAKLRHPRAHSVDLSATVGSTATVTGRVIRHRSNMPTDARFDAIEEEVQDHRVRDQEEHHELRAEIDAARESVAIETGKLEDQRKLRLARALTREEAGIWIFILGVVMTTVGAIV